MVAMVVFLWLSLLLTVDLGATGNIFASNEEQCLVKLVVNLALELQKQSQQLEKLQDNVSSLEARQDVNSANLTKLSNTQYDQDKTLKQRSHDLRGLEDKVKAMESSLKWNRQNMTALNQTLSTQNMTVHQQWEELRSLRDQVSSLQTNQDWTWANVTSLNKTHSERDRILEQQSEELNRLEDRVHSVDTDLNWITANLTDLITSRTKAVAFSVRYNQWGDLDVGANGTLKYNEVITNVGEGYSSDTGRFTAPCSGVYAFYTSLRSTNTHKWVRLGVYKGSSHLAMVNGEGNNDDWDKGNMLVTTHVEKGQEVYVRHEHGGSYIEAGKHTTFSGMLLAAD